MSFMRTLASLAAGYAAAKGVEKFREMGGMAGLQSKMASDPKLGGMADQMGGLLDKLGIPGGAQSLKSVMGQMGGQAQTQSEAAAAGLGGLMSAMGSASAAGAENMSAMFDSFSGANPVSYAMEENAKLMIRAMIQAAKSDGEIDDEEREKILGALGEEISDEERAFVQDQLAGPIDVQGLAADTGAAMKQQIYAVSAMAVRIDSSAEARYLDQLAGALGLSDDQRRQVHQAMGLG